MGGRQHLRIEHSQYRSERNYHGAYFQDDIQVTPRLTVNLGLRWEYFGQLIERYGAQSNFLPSGSARPLQFLLTETRCNTPLSPESWLPQPRKHQYRLL